MKTTISNPPFNMKWQHPSLGLMQSRFTDYGLPPENNANFAFLLSALEKSDRTAFIFPAGILTTKDKREQQIWKTLINKNYVEAIISLPGNMFESTGVNTCIIVLDKHKTTTTMELVDLTNKATVEVREQRGQFGGSAHTNRVYKKQMNTISDETMEDAINCIRERKDVNNYCKCVTKEDVEAHQYMMNPSVYFEIDMFTPDKHRPFEDIIADINRVVARRNACKLTINESVAKAMGFDVSLYKKANELDNDGIFDKVFEKLSGVKREKINYITFTKNKNEVKFENMDKETISPVLRLVFNLWQQNVYMCNEEENRLQIEFRDAFLTEVMSGNMSPKDFGL